MYKRMLLAIALVAVCAVAPARADQPKAELMFVQTADSLKADGRTLRLVGVGQQTVFFADRPVRLAGHMTMSAYMSEWTKAAGANNFAADPPNATLSVLTPGQPDSTLVVVELSRPALDGKDLVYDYKLIDGSMPASGGPATLFIDWIGVGGGVGPGFHGVGVGFRGPGFR